MQCNDAKERFVASLTNAQDLLYAYILSLFPNADLAKDILQETNLVLWRKADDFNEEMSFVTWACAIAKFQVKARRRDMQRDKLVFDDQLLDNLASEAEAVVAGDDFDDILRDCINDLPPQQRELLSQRYEAGSSLTKLAQKLGRSIGGLGVSLYRIRQTLADCMKHKMTAGNRP